MTSIMKRSKRGVAAIIISMTAIAGVFVDGGSKAEPANPLACSALPYTEFDFWVGDWDAFDADNLSKPVARTRVTRILEGCVLLEVYQGADGHVGQSFTIYDSSRRIWHQTWVTNRAELLVIEGGIRAGAMVLEGADRTKDGKKRLVRGTWKPVDGGVREVAARSTDGGKTWNPWFDLIFHPHKP